MTLDPGAVQAAYGGVASAWAAGPAAMYRRMAEPLVDACPVPLTGATVLDFGAGTGVTGAVLGDAGARVVAVDLSFDMLAIDRAERPAAVTADVCALPFTAASFDAAAGAFVVSHLPEPDRGLAEVARCVRPGGAVLTVGFAGGSEHPVKSAIEGAATRFGFVRPDWYATFKRDVEVLTSSADRLAAVAQAAGLVDVLIDRVAVETGVIDADGIIAWRLGNPMLAPFVAALDDDTRAEFLDALRAAVGDDPDPVVPELLVLSARVSR